MQSDEPRFSFTTLWESFYTVFIVVTGESWATMMAITIEQTSWVSSFYFLTLFTLGNYLMINLFICILIDSLGNYQENQRVAAKLKKEQLKESGELPSSRWRKRMDSIASFRRGSSHPDASPKRYPRLRRRFGDMHVEWCAGERAGGEGDEGHTTPSLHGDAAVAQWYRA